MASSDIRVLDRSKSRKDTPALPFCHFKIKAEKPKDSRYPAEIKTLGDHVRAKRIDLELTQKQVAERLGVHEMTINNWETGRTVPVVRLVLRIIEFLGNTPYTTPRTLRIRGLTQVS